MYIVIKEIKNVVSKYFGFLVEDYKFNQPFINYNTGEYHVDYIKHNIVISIVYCDTYWGSLFKVKYYKLINEDNKVNIKYIKPRYYNLSKLDENNTLYKSLLHENIRIRDLVYFSTLLKNNPEILNGDFRKFSLWYRIKQRLRFKK